MNPALDRWSHGYSSADRQRSSSADRSKWGPPQLHRWILSRLPRLVQADVKALVSEGNVFQFTKGHLRLAGG